MPQDKPRIALLIDADNASASSAEAILADLEGRGRVTVRRAFGNWAGSNLQQWRANLNANAIVPVQQFAYAPGKNATDMAMVINAMDLLHTGTIDAFALVSSDSDFTPLAVRLRESGAPVFGYGRANTPDAFVRACTTFAYADGLVSKRPSTPASDSAVPRAVASPAPPKKAAKTSAQKVAKKATNKATAVKVAAPSDPGARRASLRSDTQLVKRLRQALAATAAPDGWAKATSVGKELRREGAFDPRDHGSATLTKLISLTGLFEVRNSGSYTEFRDPKAPTA
jgi:NYN domain/OST-HTH/LOTUS domain